MFLILSSIANYDNNPSLFVIVFLGKMVRDGTIWKSNLDLGILDLHSSHVCFAGKQN